MDVYPDTLCMPHFRVSMSGNNWFHAPSNLHQGGGIISFTDGHVESHRWKQLKFARNIRHNVSAGTRSPDHSWVKVRTTYDPSGRRQIAVY
jgi:prepilin-type processing-associated H-X9-DG protein